MSLICRLIVSNTIVRRTSVVTSKPRRLMNTVSNNNTAVTNRSSSGTEQHQNFASRNKETVQLLGVFGGLLISVGWGVGTFWSRLTVVEIECQYLKESNVRKDAEVAKLVKAVANLETKLETALKNMVSKDVVAKLEAKVDVRAKNFDQLEAARREGESAAL